MKYVRNYVSKPEDAENEEKFMDRGRIAAFIVDERMT